MEIVADGRKDALRHILLANGREVELRTSHGNEDIYQVVDEEGGDNDEQIEPKQEIPDHYHQNHGIIGKVAHIERFADPHLRPCLTEPDGRLPAKQPLLGRGKDVVEVREDAVELKRIRIPVG